MIRIREFRPDAGLAPVLFVAVKWVDEGPAHKTWSYSRRTAHNTHVWRLAEPAKPPFKFWKVIGMGAVDDGRVRRALEQLVAYAEKLGGEEVDYFEDGFLNALALRRARMILEREAKGDYGLKTIQSPRQMDRLGRMTDVDDPR